jgi:formylglycine-generating enzyme required for sulfatase activity
VNRADHAVRGAQLRVPAEAGTVFYDLWHGRPLAPEPAGGLHTLHFDLEAHGFGAVLAVKGPTDDPALGTLLKDMGERSRQPLGELRNDWSFLPQRPVETPGSAPAAAAPPGMVRIPAGSFDFVVSGIEIEGGQMVGVDVQYPWEDSPRRHHQERLDLKAFYIDRHPVTNAEFERFLKASGYRPADDHNFLRDWRDGRIPTGWEAKPVTWVSLEDDAAFARLGREAAAASGVAVRRPGTDGRRHPGARPGIRGGPVAETGRVLKSPAAVGAHPRGASPFGVQDLVGNVWQWTDEYADDRTRAAILRGGSYYQPQGSQWYFPQAYRLDQHGKYLLMAPSLDRAGTVGFRCVKDAM